MEKKKEILRGIKFTLFSISAGIIQIVAFTLLTEIPKSAFWSHYLTGLPELSYWPRYLTALVLSVLWNFTLNRKFTFKSANNVPIAMLKVFAYYLVFTPVTTIGGNYLAETLHWNEYIVTALNMILNFTTEYLYDRFVVFGKSIDTNEAAKKSVQG